MNEEIRILNAQLKTQVDKLDTYKRQLIAQVNKMFIQHRIKVYYLNQVDTWYLKNREQLQEQYNKYLQIIQNKYNTSTNSTNSEPSADTADTADTTNKKACLIGINYTNTEHELQGCVNDVMNLKKMLETRYNYNPKNITTVINEQATRNTILQEFTTLLKTAKEGDSLFFSYSGHGTNTVDRNGDEIDGKDELLVSVDNYAIFDDELKQIIDACLKPNVKLFALFDNCHSGTILDLPYQYFKTSSIVPIVHPNSRETKGEVICLSGCRDDQVSIDAYIGNEYTGAMTRTFIDVLTKYNVSNTSNTISTSNTSNTSNIQWSVFVEELRSMLQKGRFAQVPQLTCGNKTDFTSKNVVF
jgi:hypothetical protein